MSQINDDKLEQIERWIVSLPSDFLLEKCETEEQREEWHDSRKIQILTAQCWRAKFIDRNSGDPIADALERKEISKDKHDMINLRVNVCRKQWDLIQEANQYVEYWYNGIYHKRQQFEKLITFLQPVWNRIFSHRFQKPYPFASAFDLFAETLREEVDGKFKICLETYYEVPIKKWRQAIEQLQEKFETLDGDGSYPKLSKTEADGLKNKLAWDKLTFSWLGFTLFVCQWEVVKHPSLRKKFIEFNQCLADYCKMGWRASRNIRGFAWRNGVKVPTNKYGGIYRDS